MTKLRRFLSVLALSGVFAFVFIAVIANTPSDAGQQRFDNGKEHSVNMKFHQNTAISGNMHVQGPFMQSIVRNSALSKVHPNYYKRDQQPPTSCPTMDIESSVFCFGTTILDEVDWAPF